MYFWKIENLKKDFLTKPLTESETFKYIIVTTIVYGLTMIPFLENNMWDVYSAICSALINVIGVYYIYKCNQGASGNNFLQKYLSLGWVTGIRWTVFVALPTTIIYFTAVDIFSSLSDSTTLSDIVFFNLLFITYFWRFGKHVKEIAK